MYRMKSDTKSNLEKSLGISLAELQKMTADEEKIWVEKQAGRPIRYGKTIKPGLSGRGNPLLSRRKIRTKEELDRRGKEIYGV